jgi:hypothetical protein
MPAGGNEIDAVNRLRIERNRILVEDVVFHDADSSVAWMHT